MKTYQRYSNKYIALTSLLVGLAASPLPAFAIEVLGPEITVTAKAEKTGEQTESKKARSSDTAAMLLDQPGVALQSGGGVSSLPVIHGLADDRVMIQIDGMSLISCCPNHMNPALSYLDPSQVGSLNVYAGISPVSLGGDSIGGTIVADTRAPEFAPNGQRSITKGEVGSFYRSNGNAKGGNFSLSHATENLSVSYRFSIADSDNYLAGGKFKNFVATGNPGHLLSRDEVGSTAYETMGHTLDLAWRNDGDLYEAKLAYQDVPFQLYPNQRMDMLDNKEYRINLHYNGKKSWGKLDGRIYREWVDHYMDFGTDKQLIYGSAPYVVANGMPMYTDGKTFGAKLLADIDLNKRDLVRIGAEMQLYRLDDWWPPSPANLNGMLFSAMNPVQATYAGMAPDTFWNINGGKRDRFGLFSEWEAKWNSEWMTLIGARIEQVNMNTGPVQGYNSVANNAMYSTGYLISATSFNALDRKRNDTNLDLAALVRYTPDETLNYEFGIAQKTRTPNLYERYSWSRNAMALVMNNFVGDGNGYLGNPDLNPEVAHTISVSASWHNADKSREIKVAPFYTHVTDYVDAVQWNRTTNLAAANTPGQFGILKFMNQQARLYGVDFSGKCSLGNNALGKWGLIGIASYVNGRNLDTDSGLYNVMPLNAKVSLQQKSGNLENTLEMVAVADKNDISAPRQELKTPGYTLFNWRGSYTYQNMRIDFGVENLFDKLYYMPLGGAYAGQGTTMSLTGIPYGISVPGMGRSVYLGMNYKF
ncbi:MAG: TonB-dependent receptor [Chlorobiaceae bacterium]|nr:TonB-dependent receptor [Chlorobiaceae bacterium]